MNGSPAFQFYPADWLSDEKVSAMSIEGEGCYVRLLCYCWREGSIPADRVAIARLCKGYEGPGIDEAISCFSPARKKSRLIHRRLEAEKTKQERFAKSCRDRGLSGATKRWLGHSPAIATPIAKNASLSLSSSSELREKNKSSSLCPRILADADIRLTQLLIDLMKANNPDLSILKRLTEKRRAEWENQCRLLRESDKRSPEQIEAVIRFSQDDPFWKQNILSMPKLREKWDQLWLKAQSASRGPGNGRGAESPYVGSRSPIPIISKELEKKLLAEYEVAKSRFMKAKGYKTEDDIPFNELETFFMFKCRRVREMKQGAVSC